jgi:hypothetical protein
VSPAASPYADDGYGSASFSIGAGITDYLVDYMLLLLAGEYALIFGLSPVSGGDAAMPEAGGPAAIPFSGSR